MKKIKELLKKYEEIIRYLIAGVLTTAVSWITYYVCVVTILEPAIAWMNGVANTLSWTTGVIFGYFINRIFVFQSKEKNIGKEFIQFSTSRISTLILDLVVMYVTVNLWNMNEMVAKVFISSVIGTIVNYIISKLFVFKK